MKIEQQHKFPTGAMTCAVEGWPVKLPSAYAMQIAALMASIVVSGFFLIEVFACLEYLAMRPYHCGEWGACNWRLAIDPVRAFSYVNVDDPQSMLVVYLVGLGVAALCSFLLYARLRWIDRIIGAHASRVSRRQQRERERDPAVIAARLAAIDRSITRFQDERVALQTRSATVSKAKSHSPDDAECQVPALPRASQGIECAQSAAATRSVNPASERPPAGG